MEIKDKKVLIISVVGVFVCLLFTLFYTSYSRVKIGYVRNSVLVDKYDGIREARVLYNKKLTDWKIQIDTLNQAIEREINFYEKNKLMLSASERKMKEFYLEERVDYFENFREGINKKAKEEEGAMIQSAYNQINSFVESYAIEHNYDFILGTTLEGNLMYGIKSKDITDEVLNSLNKKYKGG